MKKTARYWLVAAAGLVLAGSASAGLMQDDFETYPNLTPLINGTNQWYASDSTVLVKTNKFNSGTKAASVPGYAVLTNRAALGYGGKVWSDFYTIPRRYSQPGDPMSGPLADPSATAQIFLTSNGLWAAIYRVGVGGNLVTNVFAASGLVPVVPDDTNTWQHVSVLHDYGRTNWAFFVNDGVSLATNLTFINTSVTLYDWFSMQNGGGTNAWLDDVTITNRVPLTLTADVDNDGMLDAWEIMYYFSTGAVNSISGDTDGDGLSNGYEARNRTDPTLSGDPSLLDYEASVGDLPFYDGFEDEAPGQVHGRRGWESLNPARALVVPGPVFMGTQSLQIVATTVGRFNGGSLSSTFYPTNNATSVWTHIVLKPVPMTEEQSLLARTNTVAFYVDTNYAVNAYDGSTWVKLTNVLSNLGGTNVGSFTVDSDPANWVRFVTKSDYGTRKWSLYAENVTSSTTNKYARLLAPASGSSLLNFSSSGAAIASYQGLVVENMLDPNTTSYLDNVEITLTTSAYIDTDGDSVPDAYEEAHGLTSTNYDDDANNNGMGDRAEYAWGSTNAGHIVALGLTNETDLAIRMQVHSNRLYEMVGSPAPGAPFTYLGSFGTGPNGEGNRFVHTNGLALGNRYFYRLRAQSPEGTVMVTNEETYVWYKQRAYGQSTEYVVGIPVNYDTNNTLNGQLGADLARGLASANLVNGGGDRLHIMNSTGVFDDYWLKDTVPPTWRELAVPYNAATQAVSPGAAVLIERMTGTPDTTNAVLAGIQRTNSLSLPINTGWNLVGWPYDGTNAWDWAFTNAASWTTTAQRDKVYLVRNGLYITVLPETNGDWRVYYRTPQPTALTDEAPLQPGEALYYRRAGASDIWSPVRP
jgi:hypothetical protein